LCINPFGHFLPICFLYLLEMLGCLLLVTSISIEGSYLVYYFSEEIWI